MANKRIIDLPQVDKLQPEQKLYIGEQVKDYIATLEQMKTFVLQEFQESVTNSQKLFIGSIIALQEK